jgi:thiamine pyrophosphokinase
VAGGAQHGPTALHRDVTVVFGGVPVRPTPRLRRRLAGATMEGVIAADAGAATALAFGFALDLVVGDLDSLDGQLAAELAERGVPFERHSRDKDATDGELAVERALQRGADGLVLVGFLGGPRLDQLVANLELLTRLPRDTVLLDERNEARLLRGGESRRWAAEADEVISLVPFGGDAVGVSTEGLRWPLSDAVLPRGSTRGVSNEPAASSVAVSLRDGVLLVTRHFAE